MKRDYSLCFGEGKSINSVSTESLAIGYTLKILSSLNIKKLKFLYFALFIYFVLLYFVFTGPLYGILQLVQIFKYSLSLCIIFLMQGSADCYPVLSAQSSAASQCMFQCSVSSPVYPACVSSPVLRTSFPAHWTLDISTSVCGQDFQLCGQAQCPTTKMLCLYLSIPSLEWF